MRGLIHAGCAATVLVASLLVPTKDVSSGRTGPSAASEVEELSATGLLMETYEDGKVTPVRLIADYRFARDQRGVWQGYWRHICITPFDGQKDVCLKIEMWSIESGEITNFQSFSNGCSFDLAVGDNALFGRRTLQVIVKGEGIKRTILASGLWHSEIMKTEFKKEWRSTDKPYFELPYNRVF